MLMRRINAAFIGKDWEVCDRGARRDGGEAPNGARSLPTAPFALCAIFYIMGPIGRGLAPFGVCS
jgi:hypothetical protein